MKLIVGLGNPGAKYQSTRHNLGFMIVDYFVDQKSLLWQVSADLMGYFVKSAELVVIKPTTFMNKGGECVRAVANFYKTPPLDVLVIHDDLDLDFSKIRISFGGSSAGHKGVESVIAGLGTGDFARLRIGIDHPLAGADPEKYVLSDFAKEEQQKLSGIIKRCQEAIKSYLESGIEATMNRFN